MGHWSFVQLTISTLHFNKHDNEQQSHHPTNFVYNTLFSNCLNDKFIEYANPIIKWCNSVTEILVYQWRSQRYKCQRLTVNANNAKDLPINAKDLTVKANHTKDLPINAKDLTVKANHTKDLPINAKDLTVKANNTKDLPVKAKDLTVKANHTKDLPVKAKDLTVKANNVSLRVNG